MSQSREESGQPAGRPRDHSIDARVYAACRELLLESGWERLSMRQVAALAGVSRTSVQLRWSSKAEMVLHAILGDSYAHLHRHEIAAQQRRSEDT